MSNNFRVPMGQSGARMPEYQRRNFTTPGADVSARLSDAAAGIYERGADQTGRQLMALGGAVQEAAKVGNELYMDYQTSKAKEAWLTYKQEAAKKQAELATLQGKNALGDSGVEAQLRQWQQATRQNLSKNLGGMATKLFDNAAAQTDAGLDSWAVGKVHTEALRFENKTSEAHISLLQDEALANANDPAELAKRMSGIKGELKAIAGRSGLDETWINAEFKSDQQKILTKAIADRIEGEQMGEAASLIRTYGSELGGAAETLKARFRAKGRELESRARAERERANREQAISMGSDLFLLHRMDAEAAQAEIAEKIKDPVQQERVLQSYLTRSSLEERLQTRTAEHAKATEYVDAINKSEGVLANQSLTDKSAALTDLLGQISDPAIHKQVSEYIDFRINGTEAPVDKNVLAEAQTYAAQPGVRPDMVTTRYAAKLPPSALQKAVKIANDQATKQSEKLMQDEITESLVDDFGYSRAQATAGYRVILSRMTGLTDPAQRLERARMLAREISVKNNAWLSGSGWGSGVTIPAYDFQRMQREDPSFHLVEIPEESILMIDAALKAKGQAITEQNRKDTYINFLRGKKSEESK